MTALAARPARAPFCNGVVIIGTGLIGTSVGLALRDKGVRVWLTDRDPDSASMAVRLGAGEPLEPGAGRADLAVLAVPPGAVAAALAQAQHAGLAACYTDVASVKAGPLAQAGALGCDLTRYVPGHPLAGRERSGPAAARADLFLGRPWALCPAPRTDKRALSQVMTLAESCGAEPLTMAAADHDAWVALVSHAPHVVAAAMAARLTDAPPQALALAGQGLRDVTRIAAGDAELWSQILATNAAGVSEVLARVAADLRQAADDLALAGTQGAAGVTDLLGAGAAGVSRIPGKRGGPAAAYATVSVVIPDQPGELARLFQAAGEAGINIEDVGIEHSPGLPSGVAELAVSPAVAGRLVTELAARGWPAYASRP